MIGVLLVDDQPAVRAGLRALIEPEPDMAVVGEAADGRGVVDLARRRGATVAGMDIRMPGVDGIAATRALTSDPELPIDVLVITTYDLDDYLFGALRAGAAGFLLKHTLPEQLVPTLRLIGAGQGLVDPAVTRRLIAGYAAHAPAEAGDAALATLTGRERDVLLHLSRGLTNAQIAGTLGVEESTVKSHVTALLAKLGLTSRVQAVIYAYEQGVARVGGGPPGP